MIIYLNYDILHPSKSINCNSSHLKLSLVKFSKLRFKVRFNINVPQLLLAIPDFFGYMIIQPQLPKKTQETVYKQYINPL